MIIWGKCIGYVLLFWVVMSTEAKASSLHLAPFPTGQWQDRAFMLYLHYEGSPTDVVWADNRYGFSDSLDTPVYDRAFLYPGAIHLTQEGTTYVHVRYQLKDGSFVYTSAGPYQLWTTPIQPVTGVVRTNDLQTPTSWTNKPLFLYVAYDGNETTEGIRRYYRLRQLDNDWQEMTSSVVSLPTEGKHEVSVRVVNKAGKVENAKAVTYWYDQTPPEVHHVALTQNEQASYDALVWVTDEHAGIASVQVETAEGVLRLASETLQSVYKIDQVKTLPEKIIVTDKAGNVTEASFLSMPTVAFDGYEVTAPLHHQAIKGEITGEYDIFYTFNGKKTVCNDTLCPLNLNENGLLVITQTDGMKRTNYHLRIQNLDLRPFRLLLLSTREANQTLTFKWNYVLKTNGTLVCDNGDGPFTMRVKNNTHQMPNAENVRYVCTLEGLYEEQLLTSNTVTIDPNPNEPIPLRGQFQDVVMDQMVYLEESRAGTSYFVNVRKANGEANRVVIPIGVLQ